MNTNHTSNSSRFAMALRGAMAWLCLVGIGGIPLSATVTKHHKRSAAKAGATASSHSNLSHGRTAKSKRVRGQQKIDGERARQIQEALVREHYLSGDASGSWNTSSEEAMRRFQADHGWQTKTVPDSRALIALGLGPNQEHLLNPDSAMISGPFKNASATSASGPSADTHKH
jgi:peptidoglycan hydrolase-like protein with peptidoglycan-binding domain